ncbi:hypothetical protein KKF84_19155, partial [Myxococcota bacterium]|nr:hypothetical protein [Myxococcota bacterium]
DSLLTRETNEQIGTLLDGEMRLWWGSGITYESPNPPPESSELRETLTLLDTLAVKSLIL